MVEVFKTNIDNHALAQQIVNEIKTLQWGIDASFDLEDCDHILRVCGDFEPILLKSQIITLLLSKGHIATPLDDEADFVGYQVEDQLPETQAGIIAFMSIR